VLCLPNFLAIPELRNGADRDARGAVRARLGIPPTDLVLLFVGSIIHRKGVDLLVESFAQLSKEHPDVWLVLVGPSDASESTNVDPAYIDALRAKLLSAHGADRVKWTGAVAERGELAGYFSAADVFVFPTRAEGLGNVLVEAAAAGLPAVATDLPGVTDTVVVDGETGLLVSPDDARALTRAIVRLIEDTSLRVRMGLSARTRAGLFSFDNYCHRLREFYLRVIDSQL
jgi:glycosyltransferase involved in cell wall biosynthesis